ncbi:MAG: response regulator [Betaproteobacteria bacterium]|nr:response regulator [Betaproteobacteria bacterium]
MSAPQVRGGLFWKYLAVILFLVGGVLALSTAVDLYFSYEEAKENIIELEREKARAAAYRIEQFVTSMEREVRGVMSASAAEAPAGAPQPEASGAGGVYEQRYMDFLRMLRNVPAIITLRQLDSDGAERLSVSVVELDALNSGKDHSKSPEFLAAQSEKRYFGPVFSRDESEPHMLVAVALPETAPEVIVAEVNLKAIWDVVSRLRVGKAGYAYVVDGNGRLIAHPDLSMVLQNRDLSNTPQVKAAHLDATAEAKDDAPFIMAKGLDGGEVLAVFANIPHLRWSVFIERPLAEVVTSLRTQIWRSVALMLLGLALSVLASVMLARRMVAPIRRLQEGAARVGRGELDHRIDIRTGDELQALADEFNHATTQLQDSQRNLEQKVEARTEALTRSLEEVHALGEVGRAVSSTLDLQTVLVTIITQAVELSQADAGGTIYEFDEASGVFEPRANYRVSDAYVRILHESQIRLGESAVGKCAARRAPYQVPDVEKEEDSRMRGPLLHEGVRAVLAVPLLREERVIGALVIRRKVTGEFSPSVVTLLQALSSQSVLAIQNARLFREIEEKGKQLEVASQLKSQFLANMSHELRTPLNAIIGVTEMLHEDAVDLKLDDQLEPLERVLRAAKHLLALINDILDLSKIEAGKIDIHIESFAIAPLVTDVVQTIATMATKNDNKVVVACPAEIGTMNADQTRIRQALLNLASNANKFTEHGTVTISAGRAIEAGREWVTMAVADTGIGLTPAQMGKLFQDFVQADASITRKYGGTGLGLAISRRFCQMMGGDITVASEPGRGSTFTIRVPADCTPPRAVAAPQDAALARTGTAQAGAPTILVVDDDQTVREVMERHLTREGFAVVTANGGQEGLRLARELHPAAITLDVMMPDLDGWTVLAAIKGDPELADIPVILMTIVDEKNRGYALGATDYMVKPVDRERLSGVLRNICGAVGRQVLLVDDDDLMRRGMRLALEKDGWEVGEAENGRVALARIEATRPDIIMLDLMMPEMDGFEFLVEMRGRVEWRDIPVLVVTAKDLTAEERSRLNGDVARVLQKGGSGLDELLEEIARVLPGSIARGRGKQVEEGTQ